MDYIYAPFTKTYFMPRVMPLPEQDAGPEILAAYEDHRSRYHGRITNMKATLGRSLPAFQAYMEWYPLYEVVKKILGEHTAPLFAWSVSEAADCPLCTTYFRKVIIERGERPEQLNLSAEDQQLLTFGATMARHKGYVPDEVFAPVAARFNAEQVVVLAAFAGIMIATNIFNNVIGTQIDEYLTPFLDGDPTHRPSQQPF